MSLAHPDREPTVQSLFGRPRGGPTVLRMLLGAQLRRLRLASGLGRAEAGASIRASDSKISRMELGRVGFRERDVADLLTLYGVVDEKRREVMLDMARMANVAGWWHQYSDVLPHWFEIYVALEQAASRIRTYEVQFVPGLLQTEEYARGVVRLGHPEASAAELDRRVELRMARQELHSDPQPPQVWAVVDEAALRRPLGSAQAMRAQLKHLIDATMTSNVTLQIVPFLRGGHAAAGGPFSILRFSEPDLPDIVYMEQLTSSLYLEKREDVDHYLAVIERLCVEAEPVKATVPFLERILAEM
jgi:Domain of unknown function (DUF5753)/Helix-turn-helix domain